MPQPSPQLSTGCLLRFALLAFVLLAIVPGSAHADRREFYAQVGLGAAHVTAADSLTQSASAGAFGAAVELIGYYGLTDQLHLGGLLRASGTKDLHFSRVPLLLEDGSQPVGDLYEDLLIFDVGVVVLWRWDTGENFAPILRADLGVAHHRHVNVAHFPVGTTLQRAVPETMTWVPTAGAQVGLEYRLWDHYTATLALSARVNPGALVLWEIQLPLIVGVVF